MNNITIFRAKKVITMNPRRPVASHVAVRDGVILGAGELDELTGWGDYQLDARFADKVLMPGLIEGHCHGMEGSVWKDHFVGYYPRRGPDGVIRPARKSIEEVVEYLRQVSEQMDDPHAPLVGWGFDPIYFGSRRMSSADLDRVSTTRPVIVIHASFHIINVNSVTLARANLSAATEVMGVIKDATGALTGELQGQVSRFMVYSALGMNRDVEAAKPEALWRFARSAQLSGVTTATDLANTMPDGAIAALKALTDDPAYPLRIVPAFLANSCSPQEGLERVQRHLPLSGDKLRIGLIKLVADGSIQGYTARVKAPGYYNGAPNGLWYIEPDQIAGLLETYTRAGLQVHIHTNGDQATEKVLDAIEQVQLRCGRGDHRFTLQHCQMAHEAHYRRMAALGTCVNLFSNHLFYWGDQHYEQTMGPERAERLDAAATAQRHGVPFAIHSDAPITPLAPLFTAWCAVNRTSASGRVLGAAERISVEDALHAITLGAAYTLKLDREIGSIEAGKRADFAVLDADPLKVSPQELKDIPVWGTVLGGRVFANEEICP